MPSAVPISIGAKANGWLTDLPTRTVSAADAADVPISAAANSAAALYPMHRRPM
jgi:hypothetical protein